MRLFAILFMASTVSAEAKIGQECHPMDPDQPSKLDLFNCHRECNSLTEWCVPSNSSSTGWACDHAHKRNEAQPGQRCIAGGGTVFCSNCPSGYFCQKDGADSWECDVLNQEAFGWSDTLGDLKPQGGLDASYGDPPVPELPARYSSNATVTDAAFGNFSGQTFWLQLHVDYTYPDGYVQWQEHQFPAILKVPYISVEVFTLIPSVNSSVGLQRIEMTLEGDGKTVRVCDHADVTGPPSYVPQKFLSIATFLGSETINGILSDKWSGRCATMAGGVQNCTVWAKSGDHTHIVRQVVQRVRPTGAIESQDTNYTTWQAPSTTGATNVPFAKFHCAPYPVQGEDVNNNQRSVIV